MADGYDHNQQTGIVRAPLCRTHNVTLGFCGDQSTSLRKLADWLEIANMGFTYDTWTRERDRVYQNQRYSEHADDPGFREHRNERGRINYHLRSAR